MAETVWKTVWSEVRGSAVWDGIKEGGKLMLPFIAGFGVRQWVTDHAVKLMWAAAFVISALIAYWDHLPKNRALRATPRGSEQRCY